MSSNRKPLWRTYLPRIALVLLVTGIIEWFYFGFQHIDFSVSLFSSGDGIGGVLSVKDLLIGSNSLKGWPYFQDLSAYSARYDALSRIFKLFCGLFTKNEELVFNIYLFAIPLFNVLVCYLVLCHFKIREWLAWLAALSFGFCPYVQYRMAGHFSLAAIECIPLAFLLCVWCVEDPNFNQLGEGWCRYRRNWASLLFTWMIANNGMVYYPFFSCFILCVTALCLVLKDRRTGALWAPLTVIAEIGGWLAAGFLPTVWGYIQGFGNVAMHGAHRTAAGAMWYSLRINSLLLSPKGYGIPALKNLVDQYLQYAAEHDSFYNENAYAYMGVVAIVGFLLLLVCVFSSHICVDRKKQLYGRLWLLSRATIGILLLSVLTGFGTIIGAVITAMRCYNRISPFLVFCGIFAVTLCVEFIFQHRMLQQKSKKGTMLRIMLYVAIVIFFFYGLWEQQGVYLYFTREYGESTRQAYEIDDAFVREIEQEAGEGGMIFQLPYMRSFENGMTGDIPDYDHLRGLLHSDTLRWSYGAAKGSENDMWYSETSSLPAGELVEELYDHEFSGIWLNLDGYAAEEGAELEAELCTSAHCSEPIRCGDGHTIYIPLAGPIR